MLDLSSKQQRPINREGDSREDLLEYPDNMLLEEKISDHLHAWRGEEYKKIPKDRKWYLIAGIIVLAIVSYALVVNSPIMAITFILIGIVGYIHIEKDPRVLDFKITREGIIVGKEIYEFDEAESFWIFYEPPYMKVISLHMGNNLLPYIHIPLHEEDPTKIREMLLEYLPEKKQEPSIIDTIERLLHI